MIEDTDANLVAAALKGDAESFSGLCQRHYPALVAIAYAQLADRGMAEDAVQEALLVAYRDIVKLKAPERFVPWVATICRNTAIDMAKARTRNNHVEMVDCGPVPDASGQEDEATALVREIVLRLDATLRDVVYLKYYNRMSYGQIAQMLGISEEAVNGRLRRARDRIRQELERRRSTETQP